ncbi:MAG: GNAT family N-acetyltransferase [Pseudomonas sp.]|uniref:GNAT family N-acetyltransferase n=1 Tax=Pseudomonas sp. TaxID=306 RepID=UPI000CC71DA1|nr:GNAT family N-acetyltransferase [Pseudomonas sp.]PJI47496.1 MAG: GNAT family N-acetyltransferase [Pseudomonas sp.]
MPTLELLQLRPIVDADQTFLRTLYATTRNHEVAQLDWPPAAIDAFLSQQFDTQHRYYQAHFPDAEFCVIEADGQPIGRAYLCWSPEHLQIIDLALLPDCCGRGIGGGLLGELLARADAQGLSVGLHVEDYNPAQRLYQRHGFECVGENGIYRKLRRPPRAPQPTLAAPIAQGAPL